MAYEHIQLCGEFAAYKSLLSSPLPCIYLVYLTTPAVTFADFRSVFPFKFAHLGGDEVDTSKLYILIRSSRLWKYPLWIILFLESSNRSSMAVPRNDNHDVVFLTQLKPLGL